MSVREEFDAWAADGRDRGMAERHWHTAKRVLARMPVESGDAVLDLGTGSGYAARALRERDADPVVGLDGSPAMARNAREYTGDPRVEFVVGDFDGLPFVDDAFAHAFSMEAFYYARDPHRTLAEVARVLAPGGTFHCAVNYYAENSHSHDWQDGIDVEMTLWSRAEYREAFRAAGLAVASQDNVPDRDVEIPPADEFPHEGFRTRAAMVERYRTLGTLLTVGVSR
jgi:ubiquinone/menaquinone biosynthesis C-methylase UbiE